MPANWRRSVNFPGISRANVLRNSNFSMLPKIQRCGRKMKDRGPRFGIASTKIQRLAHRAYRVEALLDVAQGVHGEVAGAGPLGLLPLVREGMMPRWRHYHFFSRDVLEGTSEKTKIAWPKNLRGHLKILHPFGVLRNEQRREDRSTPTAQDKTKMCSKIKLAYVGTGFIHHY